MKIADIELGKRPVSLAPMEDVTDPSFRLICREMGASSVYTEFVSAEALVRDIASTTRKLSINEAERPVAIQIYGREPEAMVEAARIVEQAHPDILDINFGCPVKKVAGKGAGSGMLRDIPKLLDITRRVTEAVDLPVTVKTRLGWDCENKIITELGPRLQACGIRALTVHGRTRSQMYTGQADWTLIGELKRNPEFTIPLIGNGDITTPEQAAAHFDEYGVDGIMVGRAAIGAPWIFHDIRQYLDSQETRASAPPDRREHRAYRRIPGHTAHTPPPGRDTPVQRNTEFPRDPDTYAARRHPQGAERCPGRDSRKILRSVRLPIFSAQFIIIRKRQS